ncbi:flagellar basal body protein [Jannaschia ovalis]|uniref:Flagellar basal body protein n=1 Tax=Jannaschia ovalis TaxID=3038773 RepID=A0ABY8LIW7_9RHOB|nr:flagellar basal body protein [Jannaschia sp. GRR-S6-38]WGH80343.1 flagellar basal body protein [Jannaschia sp. GRR-S6-38]
MLPLLGLAAGAARHAAARQATISVNVANADTPGFRARDLAPFDPGGDPFALRQTHPMHLGAGAMAPPSFEISDVAADPNGNTVDLEDQILRGIEAARGHDRAVTIYRGTLDMLRASIGRR